MTPEHAQAMVDRIAAMQADYDAAHAMEDDLLRAFVRSLCDPPSLRQVAETARILRSLEELDFPRHTA